VWAAQNNFYLTVVWRNIVGVAKEDHFRGGMYRVKILGFQGTVIGFGKPNRSSSNITDLVLICFKKCFAQNIKMSQLSVLEVICDERLVQFSFIDTRFLYTFRSVTSGLRPRSPPAYVEGGGCFRSECCNGSTTLEPFLCTHSSTLNTRLDCRAQVPFFKFGITRRESNPVCGARSSNCTT